MYWSRAIVRSILVTSASKSVTHPDEPVDYRLREFDDFDAVKKGQYRLIAHCTVQLVTRVALTRIVMISSGMLANGD